MTEPGENELEGSKLPEIPLEDASKYFAWLREYHDPNRVLSLPNNQPRPSAYDYEGISLGDVEKALKAIQEQRANEPTVMRQFLGDLNPAQIVLLAMDPTARLYTEKELLELRTKEIREEKERLKQFPDTKTVIKTPQGTIKYLHATPGDGLDYTYVGNIMTRGLYCHDTGLDGVAVGLSRDDADYNLGVLAKRHRGYSGIVSIVLPIPEDPEFMAKIQSVYRPGLGRVRLDTLLVRELPESEKVQMHGAGIDYDFILPGKFIEGFFDSQKGQFVKNPNFDPHLSSDDLNHIDQRLEEFAE